MMWLIDIISTYLFCLKGVVVVLAILMLISGIDDLFIDVIYWVRFCWRSVTIYRNHKRLDYTALYNPAEKPLAIMVPAWQETGVIGQMAELAATTLDYENYHIFVGTYPNDPHTQRDVDEVSARFPNVHKVICARPGPTSKADCLNNVLDAILQFEQRANMEFAGFILHDAEDVISDMELRLFNYLVERKDLIQLPVYPFERKWTNITSLHYLDEFAELHGKDVPVREAIAGQVPSAGVGTCFSRRAIVALLIDGDGIAFDAQSLTEDYDIGFRLKKKGMSEIFVRFPVERATAETRPGKPAFGKNRRESSVICVREYFPDMLKTAIRQKSRWIIGIVYQGFKTHKWTSNWTLNYFLWRDRKGALTNLIGFSAMLIMLQLLVLLAYQAVWPGAYRFLSIFEGDPWLTTLLWLNFLLMSNRVVQRVIFVSSYYGLAQGLMSVPRIFWGNFVNFMANCRAIRQIIRHGNPHRVAWDKTSHDFPSVDSENRNRRPLGLILIEHGLIDEAQLQTALTHKSQGIKLGSWLVHEGIISAEQLAAALAEQGNVSCEAIDAYAIAPDLIRSIPVNIALHYAVLPLREESRGLVVACESNIDPVSHAALARKLNRPIRYVIAPKGQVTVGLRHWYAHAYDHDPRALIDQAISEDLMDVERAGQIWEYYVSRQIMFGEILVSRGYLDAAAFKALLLQSERGHQGLGDFLVERNVISRETLDEVIKLQRALQPSMASLLEKEGVAPNMEKAKPEKRLIHGSTDKDHVVAAGNFACFSCARGNAQ